jgi:hypothetical protein
LIVELHARSLQNETVQLMQLTIFNTREVPLQSQKQPNVDIFQTVSAMNITPNSNLAPPCYLQ